MEDTLVHNSTGLWRPVTSKQILERHNHGKVMKAEPSPLIPWRLVANLELLNIFVYDKQFMYQMLGEKYGVRLVQEEKQLTPNNSLIHMYMRDDFPRKEHLNVYELVVCL